VKPYNILWHRLIGSMFIGRRGLRYLHIIAEPSHPVHHTHKDILPITWS
jgi:hypothetical protein